MSILTKITLGDLPVAVRTAGRKGAPAVVLVHGFPFDHSLWESQLEQLQAQHFGIAYDVRGHGRSAGGDGQFLIEMLADDLLALLDHLEIERAVFCGLSMGGYIALRAREKAPHRCSALVLCDTRAEADSNEAKLKRAAAVKTVKGPGGVKTFAEGFLKGLFAPSTYERMPELVRRVQEIVERTSPTTIAGALIALAARTDSSPSLSSIDVPTLILVGEHDQLTPVAASRTMHEQIRGSKLVVVPQAGHLSNVENEALFNRELMAFLTSLPS